MPWFKIDDTLAHHPKILQAGNAALGLWVRAGSYCAQQLTDGYVSNTVLATLGTPSQAARLVAAGLWERFPDGFRFHDWQEYQPTRADTLEIREREKLKKRRQRETGSQRVNQGPDGRFMSPRDSHGDSLGESRGESPQESRGESSATRPDPTRTSSSYGTTPPPTPPRGGTPQPPRGGRRRTREPQPDTPATTYRTEPIHYPDEEPMP